MIIKKLIFVLGISAFSLIPTYGQDDWKEYEFQSHNFKIKFYQRPEFTIDSTSFNDSILITYNWSLNVTDTLHENSYYSISVVTYPSYFIHSDSSFSVVEGFINSSQDGVLEDETFTLLTSTLIEKHGFPGKVFKWKNSSNNVFFLSHFLY